MSSLLSPFCPEDKHGTVHCFLSLLKHPSHSEFQASNLVGTAGIFFHRKRWDVLKNRNDSAVEGLASIFAHDIKEQDLVKNGSPSHSSHFSHLERLSSCGMKGFPRNWGSCWKSNTFSNPVLLQMSTQVAILHLVLLATRGTGSSPEEVSKNKQSTGVLCKSDWSNDYQSTYLAFLDFSTQLQVLISTSSVSSFQVHKKCTDKKGS